MNDRGSARGASQPIPSSSSTKLVGLLVSVAIALALALLHLPFPLGEDQALFMSAAREMADGARMYGEFWDLKQPGIFWWYELAGWLFGFDDFGIRVMDLFWSVAVGALLWGILQRRGTLAAIVGSAFGLASFYAVAEAFHLSQLELVVCAPLAAIVFCVTREEASLTRRSTWMYYALCGAMIAVTALFKLLLLPLAMGLLIGALLHARFTAERQWGELTVDRAVPCIAGCVLVLAPIALWLAYSGTLGKALWTAFVVPGLMAREYQRHSVFQIISSLRWFTRTTWIFVPWMLWAVYAGVRKKSRLELLLAGWLLLGLVLISVQLLSYWEYHFDLLFIPFGMLVALGFGDVLAHCSRRGRSGFYWASIIFFCAGVCVLIMRPLWLKAKVELEAGVFMKHTNRAFALALQPTSQLLFSAADAVKGLTTPEARIVVWGNPTIYYLVGRRPVPEIDGGAYLLSSQIDEVVALLQQRRPPLIYMSNYRDMITNHDHGAMPAFVEKHYDRIYTDVAGSWFQLKDK